MNAWELVVVGLLVGAACGAPGFIFLGLGWLWRKMTRIPPPWFMRP